MKIVCTEAEYIALLDRFETDVAVIEKDDERIYRGVNTLYGVPVEVEDGNTVRVVRCKDCIVGKAYLEQVGMELPFVYCQKRKDFFARNFFCADGKRESDVEI